jgi:hypothetical protein
LRRRAQDADAPAGVPDHRGHVQPRLLRDALDEHDGVTVVDDVVL